MYSSALPPNFAPSGDLQLASEPAPGPRAGWQDLTPRLAAAGIATGPDTRPQVREGSALARSVVDALFDLGNIQHTPLAPCFYTGLDARRLCAAITLIRHGLLDPARVVAGAGLMHCMAQFAVEWNAAGELPGIDEAAKSAMPLAERLARIHEAGLDLDVQNSAGDTPLHAAVRWNNTDAIAAFAAAGAQLSLPDANGRTPLMRACKHNQLPLVQALLRAGAAPDAQTSEQLTALHIAAKYGHTAVLEALLAAGAQVEAADQPGWTALHFATDRRSLIGIAERLLKAGASLQARDILGNTPLQLAAVDGMDALIELFIAHGADPNAPNHENLTPLHFAAEGRSVAAVNALLLAGADLTLRANDERTALLQSCEAGSPAVLDRLLEAGASLADVDQYEATPLHVAATREDDAVPQIFNRLLAAGANPNAQDNLGATPLHICLQARRKSNPYRFLKACRAHPVQLDVHLTDIDNRTVLHAAAAAGLPRLVRRLLALGAAPDTQDADGKSPLHLLVREQDDASAERIHTTRRRLKTLNTLLDAHATIDLPDHAGNTALLRAIAQADHTLAQALIARGANVRHANEAGDTALHLLAQRPDTQSPRLATLLLEAGADHAALNNAGQTPLQQAFAARAWPLAHALGAGVAEGTDTRSPALDILAMLAEQSLNKPASDALEPSPAPSV